MKNSHSESITTEGDYWKQPLTTVTPLSKYLAMFLFIILPFLGFWLGYSFNESVVQVSEEKPVMIVEDSLQLVTADKLNNLPPSKK